MVRKHIIFTGSVQGVGFRYRASYAASNVGVTGFVRNQRDGSVEMEIQGTNEQINMVLKLINQSSYIVIDNMVTEDIPLDEHEYGFHVR